MAVNFPDSPVAGDIHTENSQQYIYNNSKWIPADNSSNFIKDEYSNICYSNTSITVEPNIYNTYVINTSESAIDIKFLPTSDVYTVYIYIAADPTTTIHWNGPLKWPGFSLIDLYNTGGSNSLLSFSTDKSTYWSGTILSKDLRTI